jgi:hypothetical protein
MSCRRAAGAGHPSAHSPRAGDPGGGGKPSCASVPFRSARVYAGPPASLPRGSVRAADATSPRGREDARNPRLVGFPVYPSRPCLRVRATTCVLTAPPCPHGPHAPQPRDLGDRRLRQCFAGAGVRWSGCEFARAPRAAMRPVGKARRPRIVGLCKGGATPPNGMQRRPNAEPTRDRTTGTSEQTPRRSGAGAGKH